MRILKEGPVTDPSSVLYRRCTLDLETGSARVEEIPCRNLEEVLGGFGRSFQLLATRQPSEAYCPQNPLILNTGLLTGSGAMTGLRSYFSAYSPLKRSDKGLPAAMWSAASGKFGSKLKWTGIDEVVFEGRSPEPVYAFFSERDDSPRVEVKPAGHLLGLDSHEKIMALQKRYPDAHFAVIGAGGENYRTVYMGAVALSTENQLKSGEEKCRFAGRGGMGSVMGYKNLLAVVAQSRDRLGPTTAEMREVNREAVKGGGSARFQPLSQGGGGGTWANLEVLQAFYAVPENNFRPGANVEVEGLFRENVLKQLELRTEACFRCGIRCHNNLHRRTTDGSRGEFLAKFDFEPLNLFGSNLGIHDGEQVAELIRMCDLFAMDAISLGTTIAYVLDYNRRHPEKRLFNGACFGQFPEIRELVAQTGRGELGLVGRGLKRLSEQLGETSYAMQVKGLELPAYLPETNPGYAFAIAGGHMSMGTHLLLAKEGKTGVEEWAQAIAGQGLLQVGYDMTGLCKFVGLGMGHEFMVKAIKAATGLEVASGELEASVRRAYLRGLALELRQGYADEEYQLPSQVYEHPNPNVRLPAFVTAEFMAKLKEKVWAVFLPELAALLPSSPEGSLPRQRSWRSMSDDRLILKVQQAVTANNDRSGGNLRWMASGIHPYFLSVMQEDVDALSQLAAGLHNLARNRRLMLADRDRLLIMAVVNRPGSLCETLRTLQEQEISYAHFAVSESPLPGSDDRLEIQRFEFDRKSHRQIADSPQEGIPSAIRRQVAAAMKRRYPQFDFKELGKLLRLLWLNNRHYVRISPPLRVARILWLYQQAVKRDGIHLELEASLRADGGSESRLIFAVGDPPQREFLLQVMEIFNRLAVSVKRAYCLTISNGSHPYFLGTFYLAARDGSPLPRDSELFLRLRQELCATRILSTASVSYQELVVSGAMDGDQALLVNAFIGFCHTNLAHTHPETFDLEGVVRAFHNHADLTLQLAALFKARFDPELTEREGRYLRLLEETSLVVENYNTGHLFLDDFRRAIFRCALLFIRHTLKTNYFVLEKQALAFRLDPRYLDELDGRFTCDLPGRRPFRITYFHGRHGLGYHIGFSDIARGGWRTLITHGRDDYVTCANALFRENYVLAHTQHLKNKDIYEGGSKMVVVLDAAGVSGRELVDRRLHKLQYGLINAFLDVFVTENGRAKDPRVVDYYGEDEAIELGPDENMHDVMVEMVAAQSVKRGYLLGIGIMSSKKAGINHKQYGVTSVGVVKFAEITMAELGIDVRRDPFSVKFTGGPNGDVAGNAMRLLLERCPQVSIKLLVDGSGALYDPAGLDRRALARIVLRADLDAYDPQALHPGGFVMYRSRTRRDGMRELFLKVQRTEAGLEELWVGNDEFHREYNGLIFTVPADLFIPAGGRPETVDADNCGRFFAGNGAATTRAIVEGANSFLTPSARVELQKRGIVVMRDASANKCGVISSSYEIIANLLLSEKELVENKEAYVADVIAILDRRAEDEAKLIFRRHREAGGTRLYTEISEAISTEINAHYARLFSYFQKNPQSCGNPLYRKALLRHLPRLLTTVPRYRARIKTLPAKYRYAMLSSEIASSMVYGDHQADDYPETVESHLRKVFSDWPNPPLLTSFPLQGGGQEGDGGPMRC